jgi:polyisoprenyl-teichoic acid--peptidoglycan teichoic acid transferase
MIRFIVVLIVILLSQITFAQREVPADIPEAMPLIELPKGQDIVTFLLFGVATSNPRNPGLTDMLMLVIVNKTAGSAAMLSIPRDIWVNIPGYDMHKINQAYYIAETHNEGTGVDVLKETIKYNFGIEVDHYARVNFDGFRYLIDEVGGIQITVDCIIQDWILKEPGLDISVAENYEMYTLPIGIHTLNSHYALWYVRSRRTSSDIDRGHRQQEVLRALWRKIRAQGVLQHLPSMWREVTNYVDTDLDLAGAAALLPTALTISPESLMTYKMKIGEHLLLGLSPSPERSSILVAQRDAITSLMHQFVQPPTPNQIAQARLVVQLVNASGIRNLHYVAADRLVREGFTPVIVNETTPYRNYTAIYDFTGQTKNSPLPMLKRILRVNDEGVVIEPDANRASDFKIYLGNSYSYWSCSRDVIQPQPTPEPTPES